MESGDLHWLLRLRGGSKEQESKERGAKTAAEVARSKNDLFNNRFLN